MDALSRLLLSSIGSQHLTAWFRGGDSSAVQDQLRDVIKADRKPEGSMGLYSIWDIFGPYIEGASKSGPRMYYNGTWTPWEEDSIFDCHLQANIRRSAAFDDCAGLRARKA